MELICGFVFEHSSAELEAVYNSLTSSRRERIDRLALKEDRYRSLLAELLARRLLDRMGSKAQIESDQEGRPYLSEKGLFISLSHSADAAVCVIDKKPVGVDVEKLRPVKRRLAERVCTPEEREYVLGSETGEALYGEAVLRFFEVWTAKEAYFKSLGEGNFSPVKINTLTLDRQTTREGEYVITVINRKQDIKRD